VSVLYLYALVSNPPRDDMGRGLRRERLEILPGRGFQVVVGRMDAPPARPTPADVRRHDAAVRRIAAATDAVLPMRFGAVVADEAAAGRAFMPRASELARRLRHVRAREQMTLRLFNSRKPSPADGPVPHRAGARLGPGTRYLTEQGRRSATAEPAELSRIRQALQGLVIDERIQRHATPPLVASVYHLVPRGVSGQYRRRLARAAKGLAPLRLTVSGPWPPYAFGDDGWR
jgi:hypothetical protein